MRKYGDQYEYSPMVISDGDIIVGYVTLVCDPTSFDDYWIDDIVIDGIYQGRGYGRAAMKAVLELMQKRYSKCRVIRLTCFRGNDNGGRALSEPRLRADRRNRSDVQGTQLGADAEALAGVTTSLTVSGSRRIDLAMFALLAIVAIIGSWRMRVYFRVNVAEVSATRIEADGTRHPIELPQNFARGLSATFAPVDCANELTFRMRRFTEHEASTAHIEWRVRYSYDSSRLDRERVLTLPATPR